MTQSAQGECPPPNITGWVRIVLRVIALLLWLLICLPPALLFSVFTRLNPLGRIFLSGVARIMGLSVTTHGKPIHNRAVILANHVSWLDIPALSAIGGSAFVAHSGLADNAGLRFLCSLNNTVFVAREKPRSVNAQVQSVRDALNSSHVMTIFPEGTTGPGYPVLPFKSSLLSAITPLPEEIAVRPVLLDYGADTETVAWIGEETGIQSFIKIAARKKRVTLSIHLLEPLEGEALTDRKTIASAAREAISRRLEATRRDQQQ